MKYRYAVLLLTAVLLCAVNATAQLVVTVLPVKVVGQKAVVKLTMENNLSQKIESARAAIFLLDEQGEMVGQSSKWVIGQNKGGLEPKQSATFNFVITSPHPFTTTNLMTRVSFNRVVLEDGKLADVIKEVTVTTPATK
jgi:hypothetical protein